MYFQNYMNVKMVFQAHLTFGIIMFHFVQFLESSHL